MTPAERILAAHYAATFEAHASGRVVLDDLRRQFEHRPSYVPGDDVGTVAAREGERNVCLYVRAQLEAARADPAAADTGQAETDGSV